MVVSLIFVRCRYNAERDVLYIHYNLLNIFTIYLSRKHLGFREFQLLPVLLTLFNYEIRMYEYTIYLLLILFVAIFLNNYTLFP